MESSNKDKTIPVPLTSSLYVPGKLADVKKVVVDIGTGHYVDKVENIMCQMRISVIQDANLSLLSIWWGEGGLEAVAII